MEMTDILTAVSTVGFPIVMVLLMWLYITKEQKQTREILNDLKSTINTLTEVIRGTKNDKV